MLFDLICKSTLVFLTLFATKTMSANTKVDLSYEDLLAAKAKGDAVLIDVRENSEIQETGKLPGSIHIPLGDLKKALSESAEDFKRTYGGVEQPTKESELIFSCRSGNRSRKAMAVARELGFLNVRHYAGGWLDWAEKTKQ